MKRRWLALATGIGAVMATMLAPISASATVCDQVPWGSLEKVGATTKHAPMVDVRAGRHQCFERLVIDVDAGGADGFIVEYVNEVTQPGSGDAVAVRGGAALQIMVNAPTYDSETGQLTYQPENRAELVNVNGWQTFRQVALAGSFEGETTIGLGVRARLPFRVFVLDGPGNGSRIVIDVRHFWS